MAEVPSSPLAIPSAPFWVFSYGVTCVLSLVYCAHWSSGWSAAIGRNKPELRSSISGSDVALSILTFRRGIEAEWCILEGYSEHLVHGRSRWRPMSKEKQIEAPDTFFRM